MIEGAGGLMLATRTWRPDGQPRGVVVAVHGFKAHSGLFAWAAEQLTARGLAVYALDLRGHGRSEGERLYVEKFSDYVEDVKRLVEVAKMREPGLPVFVLGHSAGGVVASMYALEHQTEIAGLISESFAHVVPAPDFALALIKGISYLAPRLGVLDLKDDDFSRDPAFVERMKSDPLISHAAYPSHTVAEMVRADEQLREGFSKLTLPVLVMHGTDDKVTLPKGSKLFDELGGSSDKTLKLYDGYAHDLLNDLGREAVMNDIVDWTTRRLQPAQVS
ncbi:MAG: lysophospholipase [Labilithrix sp.]|nr:lysophospholipase [Labilithrix sp.]